MVYFIYSTSLRHYSLTKIKINTMAKPKYRHEQVKRTFNLFFGK
jgi:hypothetical protein